jgi:branched-chain amino acid transport system ATP-binding protein
MSGDLLEISRLSMRFGGFTALDDVSLTIPAGGATAIVGPNGAGKTTLLNCLCGMYRPTAGSIRFKGRRVDGLRPHRVVSLGMARTFQSVEQFRAMTPVELGLLGRHQHFGSGLAEAALTLPRARHEERVHAKAVRDLLERLGIGAYADRRLETLPYAVRKLADLVRALATEPELLLLDEPGAGTGASEKDALVTALNGVRGDLFHTLVVIDHDMQFIQDLCDRAVVLDFGRKIAEGSTPHVLADRQVVEAYLGAPTHAGE